MKKLFAMGAALLLFGTGVIGCTNTAQGAAEDATKDTQAVKDAAATAADKTVEGTKMAGQAIENGAANAGKAVEKGVAKTGEAVADAGKAVEHGAANAGKAVEKGAADVAAGTAAVAKGASDLTLTPKVKTAILQEPSFSNIHDYTGPNIDTKTDKKEVVLRGKVKTAEMKKAAEQATEKVLKDNKSEFKVVNQMTVGM